MEAETIIKHFGAVGARVKIRDASEEDMVPKGFFGRPAWFKNLPLFTIDIGNDKDGEFFEINRRDNAPEFEILQAVPDERHLLLYARDGQRFLCGHDERHWFVAAIEQKVSTVAAAKRSLVPQEVAERIASVRPRRPDSRRNGAFVRQGEWFFVPTELEVSDREILRNEPLQRDSSSKPHWCEELFRSGGELVYIVDGLSQVLSEPEYRKQKLAHPHFDRRGVRTMIANPEVFVRGRVRHPDHATIVLLGWHRVFVNTEATPRAIPGRPRLAASIRFLD